MIKKNENKSNNDYNILNSHENRINNLNNENNNLSNEILYFSINQDSK